VLKSIGWYPFLRKFKGHNDSVTKAFTIGFDIFIACIGDLVMVILEELMAQSTRFPQIGKCGSKIRKLNRVFGLDSYAQLN